MTLIGNRRSYFQLLIVALLWGGSWVAGKIAVTEISPVAVASWRFLFAALVLGALLHANDGLPTWRLHDWLSVTALGVSGIFLYNLCFFYGLRQIEAGRGSLIVALTPAVIATVDSLFFGAPVTVSRVVGVLLALMGCLVVVTRGEFGTLSAMATGGGTGDLLILGCVVLWTAYTFIGRRLSSRISPLAATFGASLTGWVMLTLVALAEGSLFELDRLSLQGAASILFLGVFVTALSFTWYAAGVRDLGATRAGMFINLVPVFGVLLGALILHERLALSTLGGGALVVLGVTLLNVGARRS